MLKLNQNTKKNKFLNRQILQLTNMRRNRIPTIEYLVDRNNNTKTLDPNSGIGIVLSTSGQIVAEIHSRINCVDYPVIGSNINQWTPILEYSERKKERKQRRFDEADGVRIERGNELQFEIQIVNTIKKLMTSGFFPDDLVELRDARRALRRQYSDRNPHNNNPITFSEKIKTYKRKWDTCEPNNLSQYIPQGQAIGVEIEWIAPALLISGDGEEDCYDRSSMDFVRPTEHNLADGTASQHIYGTSWGYDSSIDPRESHQYHTGQEVRVMLKRGVWDRLRKTCNYIKAAGGEINKNCGLHVHLDVRDLSLAAAKTRGRRLEAALPWLLTLVPKSRRDNSYCKSRFSTDDKYAAISMSQFRYRKSIEVRLHSATLNATKIINWIDLLYFLKERYSLLPTFEDFLNAPDAPAHLKEWAINRKNKFTPPVEPEQDVESEQIAELPTPADVLAAAGLPQEALLS